MILDSRVEYNENYRRYTCIGAVAYFLTTIKKDDKKELEKLIDIEGNDVDLRKTRMFIGNASKKLGIKVITRVISGNLTVIRV